MWFPTRTDGIQVSGKLSERRIFAQRGLVSSRRVCHRVRPWETPKVIPRLGWLKWGPIVGPGIGLGDKGLMSRVYRAFNARGLHSRSSSSSLAQPGLNSLPRRSGTGIDSAHRATGPDTNLPSMSYGVGAVHQAHSRHASSDDRQSVTLPPIRDSTSFEG
ncbi:hypothetical protein K438DRAFT_2012444 [Mycena galopus ATCC 62051]|nr:hypothetical protein K438DRAFT_2012444 [Mycena galopus ATCC 62051]